MIAITLVIVCINRAETVKKIMRCIAILSSEGSMRPAGYSQYAVCSMQRA